jgi:hypothetical protein
MSVTSAVLATLLALSFGFTWVLWIGGAMYGMAWLSRPTAVHPPVTVREQPPVIACAQVGDVVTASEPAHHPSKRLPGAVVIGLVAGVVMVIVVMIWSRRRSYSGSRVNGTNATPII